MAHILNPIGGIMSIRSISTEGDATSVASKVKMPKEWKGWTIDEKGNLQSTWSSFFGLSSLETAQQEFNDHVEKLKKAAAAATNPASVPSNPAKTNEKKEDVSWFAAPFVWTWNILKGFASWIGDLFAKCFGSFGCGSETTSTTTTSVDPKAGTTTTTTNTATITSTDNKPKA